MEIVFKVKVESGVVLIDCEFVRLGEIFVIIRFKLRIKNLEYGNCFVF